MASDGRPLGEVVEDILDRRGVTPYKLGGDFCNAGHRVISAKLVKHGRIDLDADTPRFVDSIIYKKWMKSPLRDGDVVMTSEAPMGELAYLDRDVDWVLGQRLFAIRPRKSVLVGRYLYYALAAPAVKQRLEARASGTTVIGIRQAELRKVEVPVPPLDCQRAIAELLGALDDRIDNLRATNATLEAIAQALFKSWFVDFDPVHAKAEDRAPAGMDAATAALFPSAFEDSELGPIPKGWRVKSLAEIADYLNGLALQKYPPESGEEFLPVIKIAQLHAGHTRGADKASAHLQPEYVVGDGDVLFSWSGSLEVEVWCGGSGALNQHLFKVTSSKVPKWFCYFATRQHLRHFREIAANKATTMGHIQRRHLTEAKVVVPPDNALSALSEFVGPMFHARVNNALRIRSLEELRDTLLPRLISGKLQLPDAERLAEEVA